MFGILILEHYVNFFNTALTTSPFNNPDNVVTLRSLPPQWGSPLILIQNGDDALVDLFRNSDYDVVATDDAKLTRRLIANDIPFILPALIIFKLFADKQIDRTLFSKAMNKLAPFISKDEYSTVVLLAEKEK